MRINSGIIGVCSVRVVRFLGFAISFGIINVAVEKRSVGTHLVLCEDEQIQYFGV